MKTYALLDSVTLPDIQDTKISNFVFNSYTYLFLTSNKLLGEQTKFKQP